MVKGKYSLKNINTGENVLENATSTEISERCGINIKNVSSYASKGSIHNGIWIVFREDVVTTNAWQEEIKKEWDETTERILRNRPRNRQCIDCRFRKQSLNEEPCARCDEEPKQTNGDVIRAMTDEELAKIIMCPYDTEPDMCGRDDCVKCSLEWLQKGDLNE